MKGIEWVTTGERPKRMSERKLRSLWNRLRDLELSTLGNEYSAEHSYSVPNQEAMVKAESGAAYTVPAQTDRIVTHGETYELRVESTELTLDSTVYAPLAALEWKDPPHPDRPQIAKIVSAWYYILHATGPVAGWRAKFYRAYVQ